MIFSQSNSCYAIHSIQWTFLFPWLPMLSNARSSIVTNYHRVRFRFTCAIKVCSSEYQLNECVRLQSYELKPIGCIESSSDNSYIKQRKKCSKLMQRYGMNIIFGAPDSFNKPFNRRCFSKLHYQATATIQVKRHINKLHAIESVNLLCSSVRQMVDFVLQLIQCATFVLAFAWMGILACMWFQEISAPATGLGIYRRDHILLSEWAQPWYTQTRALGL